MQLPLLTSMVEKEVQGRQYSKGIKSIHSLANRRLLSYECMPMSNVASTRN